MAGKDTCWMTSLAFRDNLFQGSTPHVPILVEDLAKYVSLIDYEENCVKTVQTIGKVGSTFISSITPGQDVKFPFSMNYISPFDMYKSMNDEESSVQKCIGSILKVFGFLQRKDEGIVLVATQVKNVEDAKGSLQTIALLSRLARRQYRQYCRTAEMDKLLEAEWNRMHIEGRRK